ncbi:MAG TPA: DUF2231 domain-containing protein [Mycobacteriales bacterium]|nr:DUF2231 domain-containing protein [Mycobacteriales bacterium]
MPAPTLPPLERTDAKLRELGALDVAANPLAHALETTLGRGKARQVLSGSWLGHPLHAALVGLPIGSFIGATVLDITSPKASERAARRLVGLGIVSALPAVLAGLSDWSTMEAGPARRVGLVHAATMDVATVLGLKSWRMRGRGHHVGAAAVSALSLGFVGFGAWLGGQLAYDDSPSIA